MTAGVNCYGDRRILAGDGGHGIDVAAQRADALDEMALAEIRSLASRGRRPAAADLGCGSGGQLGRMALAGAAAVGVDVSDQRLAVAERAGPGAAFVRMDLRDIALRLPALPFAPWDVVVSQRTLHYLPHRDAAALLRALRERYLRPGGLLLISASGMGSELADGYPDRARPVAERRSALAAGMQEKHGIRGDVCLYHPQELADLAAAAGFAPFDVSASSFGNAKVAARA